MSSSLLRQLIYSQEDLRPQQNSESQQEGLGQPKREADEGSSYFSGQLDDGQSQHDEIKYPFAAKQPQHQQVAETGEAVGGQGAHPQKRYKRWGYTEEDVDAFEKALLWMPGATANTELARAPGGAFGPGPWGAGGGRGELARDPEVRAWWAERQGRLDRRRRFALLTADLPPARGDGGGGGGGARAQRRLLRSLLRRLLLARDATGVARALRLLLRTRSGFDPDCYRASAWLLRWAHARAHSPLERQLLEEECGAFWDSCLRPDPPAMSMHRWLLGHRQQALLHLMDFHSTRGDYQAATAAAAAAAAADPGLLRSPSVAAAEARAALLALFHRLRAALQWAAEGAGPEGPGQDGQPPGLPPSAVAAFERDPFVLHLFLDGIKLYSEAYWECRQLQTKLRNAAIMCPENSLLRALYVALLAGQNIQSRYVLLELKTLLENHARRQWTCPLAQWYAYLFNSKFFNDGQQRKKGSNGAKNGSDGDSEQTPAATEITRSLPPRSGSNLIKSTREFIIRWFGYDTGNSYAFNLMLELYLATELKAATMVCCVIAHIDSVGPSVSCEQLVRLWGCLCWLLGPLRDEDEDEDEEQGRGEGEGGERWAAEAGTSRAARPPAAHYLPALAAARRCALRRGWLVSQPKKSNNAEREAGGNKCSSSSNNRVSSDPETYSTGGAGPFCPLRLRQARRRWERRRAAAAAVAIPVSSSRRGGGLPAPLPIFDALKAYSFGRAGNLGGGLSGGSGLAQIDQACYPGFLGVTNFPQLPPVWTKDARSKTMQGALEVWVQERLIQGSECYSKYIYTGGLNQTLNEFDGIDNLDEGDENKDLSEDEEGGCNLNSEPGTSTEHLRSSGQGQHGPGGLSWELLGKSYLFPQHVINIYTYGFEKLAQNVSLNDVQWLWDDGIKKQEVDRHPTCLVNTEDTEKSAYETDKEQLASAPLVHWALKATVARHLMGSSNLFSAEAVLLIHRTDHDQDSGAMLAKQILGERYGCFSTWKAFSLVSENAV